MCRVLPESNGIRFGLARGLIGSRIALMLDVVVNKVRVSSLEPFANVYIFVPSKGKLPVGVLRLPEIFSPSTLPISFHAV